VKTEPSEEDPDLTSVYDDRGRCLGQKFFGMTTIVYKLYPQLNTIKGV
jgi:hypothetical protein